MLSSVSPASPKWGERFYFNLIRPTGEIVAIVGGGLYPARGVGEFYFCRMDGERQVNVRTWQPLPGPEEEEERTGGFSLRCDAPLRDWSVGVDVDGLRFDGRFAGTAAPFLYETIDVPASEPGGALDRYQHFIAPGRWEIEHAGGIEPSTGLIGVRDRTWGVRSRRPRLHLWSVFHVGDACLALMRQELADGSPMCSEGALIAADGRVERLSIAEHDLVFHPEQRLIEHGSVRLDGPGGTLTAEFERVGAGIRLAGAGYDDSQGDRAATGAPQHDEYDLADPAVAARTGRGTTDAGARVRVTGAFSGEGVGVVETAVARDHVRYGRQVGAR